MKKIIYILPILLLLSSCQSPNAYVTEQQYIHLAPTLRVKLNILNRDQTTNSAGFTVVNLHMQNRMPGEIDVESKVEWFDQNRIPVEALDDRWTEFKLSGREMYTKTFVAPSRNAIYYKIFLR